MIELLMNTVVMFLTYITAACCIFPLMRSLLAGGEHGEKLALVVSLGFGPLLISLLLELALSLDIAGSYVSLLTITLAGLLALGALFVFSTREDSSLTGLPVKALLGFQQIVEKKYTVLLVTLGLVILFFVLEAVLIPMTANDPLEYAMSARQIYLNMSLSDYPYVDTNGEGYYGPWTHPIAYVGLFLWGFIVQGGSDSTALINMISVYYFALLALLPVALARSNSKLSIVYMTSFAIMFTPLLFIEVIDSHIDPLRIFCFTSFILVYASCRNQHAKALGQLSLGLLLGLALYSHSINLLMLPLFVIVHGLTSTQAWFSRWKTIAFVLSVGISLNLYRYIVNFDVFGSPIADAGAVPVWGLEFLAYDEYFRIMRGFVSEFDRWAVGAGKLFFNPLFFGVAIWLFIASLFIQLKRSQYKVITFFLALFSDSKESRTQLFALGFIGMVVVSVVLGIDSFIKNDRYMLTVVPLLILSAYLFFDESSAEASDEF